MNANRKKDSIRLVALVDKASDWSPELPDIPRMTVDEYLRNSDNRRGLKLINLCNSYRYLGTGYYASLLAEARGHRIIPNVATITGLSSAALPRLDTAWLEQRLQARLADEPNDRLQLLIAFGRCPDERVGGFARRLFESLACPILRVELKRDGVWRIQRIRGIGLRGVPAEETSFVGQAMVEWLGRRWRRPKDPDLYRYDMAILVDPDEALPPSDDAALRYFVRAGRRLGLQVEMIRKKDFGRLSEFDALFIRTTTRIDHYTYRFARKAALEGIAVIDDPQSILRCTNKVYLAELLAAHRVPHPSTRVISRDDWKSAPEALGWPVVLKVPDGAFSTGVFKAENPAEYERICKRLFHDSDLLLAQSWLYTNFDWRVGILDGKPLYACQYFMSDNHWQIYHHDSDKGFSEGESRTLRVEDAPPEVIETAVRAATPIGNGLYGVDLKQNEHGVYVIEINDNPNIDHGIEDACLGRALYDEIMQTFLHRIEARHQQRGRRS
ncbi:RimK family protein [Natronospira bacteriovora]|uniref:RimK family protein n=1 Tax=Natronospira bacteriovora TaxID=3069753 RepID=A0ABU0W8E5_9GAMM|nr:RimK family protein [Natronospira sp. AB-CW4]MDQ2070302.1 RimK family protein [Natronospira sp. AB-CW4]